MIELSMEKTKKCLSCYGYGMWTVGLSAPMGPIDASDGMPTTPCPECGANANPIKTPPESKQTSEFVDIAKRDVNKPSDHIVIEESSFGLGYFLTIFDPETGAGNRWAVTYDELIELRDKLNLFFTIEPATDTNVGTKPASLGEWSKEFDKQFVTGNRWSENNIYRDGGEIHINRIKSFIAALLEKEREKQEDYVNKMDCLIGYLDFWNTRFLVPLPEELSAVIKEADEFISQLKKND